MTKPGPYEQWRDLRSQLQHEDGLVNQRLLWMLAFSGFLFASYGYSLTAEATLVTKIEGGALNKQAFDKAAESIRVLRLAICLAGASIGLAALVGSWAAFYAIVSAASAFNVERVHGFYKMPIGTGMAPKLGIIGGMAFPCITIGVWSFLAMAQLGLTTANAAGISAAITGVGVVVACGALFEGSRALKRAAAQKPPEDHT